MERLGKSTINPGNPTCQWQIMTNKPHEYAMHSKTSEENIHATRYMQEKPIVVVYLDVLLCFPTFPFLLAQNLMYVGLLQECSKKILSDQEYERESRKWELQNWTNKKLNTDKSCELILTNIFINQASNLFIFPLFSFIFLLTCNLWRFTFLFS